MSIQLFAFTSVGARVDQATNRCRHPYVFSICDQAHHRIGSLVPCSGAFPRLIVLYVYDTDKEIDNRIYALDASENTEGDVDPRIVSDLMTCLMSTTLW